MKMKKVMKVMAAVALAAAVSWSAWAGGLNKPTSKNAEAQKLIDQAWQLYKSDSSADTYKQCYELLEKADQLDPDNPEILIDLARYYWCYGDSLPKATPEQQEKNEGLYEKGMDFAEKSLDLKESAGAHYWFAVNKSAGLEFSNIMSQAAAFPSIYSHSQYVTNNQPDYYYGGPGRLWSEILSRVPKKVVELVGWDVNEAVGEIDNAIKLEPRYLDNFVYKARFYHVYFEDNETSLKLLETALSADPNAMADETTANRVAQDDGKEMWKQITGKDYPNK